MDLQEWEILPDDGFLEIHDDGGKKIFSRKYYGGGDPNTSVFNMNYFICPSPKSQKTHPHHLHLPPLNPIPLQLDHQLAVKEEEVTNKVPKAPNIGGAVETDQDTVSQVFFKKMKENEFVDMKMDSPKSSGSRGILPQPQIDAAPKFQFEDTNKKGEETMELEMETEMELELELEGKSGSEMRIEKENRMELDSDENGNGGINLWKWSLNGIGAICTFGVAAATICIVILGSHHRNNQHRQQHQQFQIYPDQKRMKQVVQHASKLNEAMSAVRGVAVPLTVTRAHFTFGGYYNDGLL
ncbi:hypothetical protein ACSBR2_033940 [Camellia fascicularis]